MSFRMIVGLGNPGAEYAATRHNIGFRIIDRFAQAKSAGEWIVNRKWKGEIAQFGVSGGEKVYLLKPLTFMNESGSCIRSVSSFYRIPPEAIILIYDEINLDVGDVKASAQGGPGGHNGVRSVMDCIKPVFTRFRVGIGRKSPREMDLADYVLGRFSDEDEGLIDASMERYMDCLDRLLNDGVEKAMTYINRKQKDKDKEDGQL